MDKHYTEQLRLRRLLDKSYGVIYEKFKGIVDKGGEPYEYHCLRVAEAVEQSFKELPGTFQRKCEITAVLHDVIKDTDTTEQQLLSMGFDEDIVGAVVALSRKEGESYCDFILRCKGNKIAKIVKRYDLEDNMDIRRLTELDDYDLKRLKKYWYSWMFIKDEISELEYVETMVRN